MKMKNYYEFDKLIDDEELINYFNSMSNKQLIDILNSEFDNIDYNLNYYAEFIKDLFNGNDYDEHYYNLKSLSEELNDIKIILNILYGRDFDD